MIKAIAIKCFFTDFKIPALINQIPHRISAHKIGPLLKVIIKFIHTIIIRPLARFLETASSFFIRYINNGIVKNKKAPLLIGVVKTPVTRCKPYLIPNSTGRDVNKFHKLNPVADSTIPNMQ